MAKKKKGQEESESRQPPARSKPVPRDCHPISAINPNDGTTWEIYVRNSLMDWAFQRGAGAARELGYTVREEVLRPKSIWRGVRDEGEAKWLCYVCRPSKAYDYRTGELRRAWPNQVFLVVVDDDLIIRRFFWVKASLESPDLPENYEQRLEERLWDARTGVVGKTDRGTGDSA